MLIYPMKSKYRYVIRKMHCQILFTMPHKTKKLEKKERNATKIKEHEAHVKETSFAQYLL